MEKTQNYPAMYGFFTKKSSLSQHILIQLFSLRVNQ